MPAEDRFARPLARTLRPSMIRAEIVQAEQTEPEHHERERRSVIQASLRCEAETQTVTVIRLEYLYVRREDRVRRGENRAEQQRRTC